MPKKVIAKVNSYSTNQYWKKWEAELVAIPDIPQNMAANTNVATTK
jgi:hypothetical protein